MTKALLMQIAATAVACARDNAFVTVAGSGLTDAQQQMLQAITLAGPQGLVLDKQITAANSLLRKGLVSRVDVETLPATKVYPDGERSLTHTLRGRLRYVTLSRYTAL